MDIIQKDSCGLYRIAIRSANARDLRYLLDPAVPLVHLSNHDPKRTSEWWKLNLPLSEGSASQLYQVRLLSFDIELATKEFLEKLDQFSSHGLELIQTDRSLPPNIVVRYLPRERATEMLLEYGMESRYFLPHPGEVAVFTSRSQQVILRALENPEIANRCIANKRPE